MTKELDELLTLRVVWETYAGRKKGAPQDVQGVEGWEVTLREGQAALGGMEGRDGGAVHLVLEVARGAGADETEEGTVGLRLDFKEWSRDVYVMLPGAVYAGNRQPAFATPYPPVAPAGEAGRGLQTCVPRLRWEEGPSCLRQLTSDPAFPGVGLFFPGKQRGLWVLTPSHNELGLLGYEMEEDAERRAGSLTVFTPGLRREFSYEICNDAVPSEERARSWKPGDKASVDVVLWSFGCEGPAGFLETVPLVRRAMVPAPLERHEIPFSEVWRILEEKYLRDNWVEPPGYFSVGVEPLRSRHHTQDWQIGWVGGMINTHALLLRGCEESVRRVWKNFDFVFERGQAPSGYFYPSGDPKQFYPDAWEQPWEKRCLVRKCGDALFYMLSTLDAAERAGRGAEIKPLWLEGLRRCTVAFLETWRRHGEWGQFVNHDTGDIVVPGSTSGAIVPAALVLAGRRFGDLREQCFEVASAAGQKFWENFLDKGLTTGGPGDAAQCPDSESAAGLLESYVTLFEETGEERWARAARLAGLLCASWTVSYDFPFPPESTFGKLGMLSNGTVLANAQNKHSAPGICTHSGLSLLRLFRHTGEEWMMDLLRDIAHALPQYMSREDRPIPWKITYFQPEDPEERTLRPGWMCERVNLTYWGGQEWPGEVFYYSCWSEVSLLLTVAELPGVYAQPDGGRTWSLDHVQSRWEGGRLLLRNTTGWDASCRVLIESRAEAQSTRWPEAARRMRTVMVPRGAGWVEVE